MSTDTLLAVLLVLLGAGGVGGMVVMEMSRLGVLTARRALVQKRIDTMRAEEKRAKTRAGEIESSIERGQAQLTHLAAEVQRLASLARTVEADRVELVHDLGTPDGQPAPYRCVLRTVPDFARIDPRHVVFSREIWQRKNVAHVWAESPEQAQSLLTRAFPTRTGVLPGAIEKVAERASKPAPKRAPEPDPMDEPALDAAPQVAA